MTNNLEIIVEINGVKWSLDLNGVEDVPLNLSLDDITDISSVDGSWSKSIVIPASDHNLNVYNMWLDPNISSKYDVKSLSRAYIISNSVLQLEGNFTIKESFHNYFDGKKTLTINVYGDSVDLWSLIGDKELDTLDLSEYNHVYNYTSLYRAWAATSSYLLGFDYPLIDNGQDWNYSDLLQLNATTTEDFIPWIYVRPIFDKILLEEGYSWTSSSLTQSTPFDELIINNGTGEVKHNEDYLNNRVFRVGVGSFQNILNPTAYNYPQYNNVNFQFNLNQQPTGWLPQYLNQVTSLIQFNNETAPNGDPNNFWNSSTYQYVNNTAYPITQRFYFNFEIDQRRLWPMTLNNNSLCWPRLTLRVNGVAVQTAENYNAHLSLPVTEMIDIWTVTNQQPYGGSSGYEKYVGSFNTPLMTLQPGDVVTMEYTYVVGGNIFPSIPAGNVLAVIKESSIVWNKVDNIVRPNELMVLSNALPKKFKRRDFLMSIIKMFNLIIQLDKTDNKKLLIEVSDNYYDIGEIEDWTSKIDKSKGYIQIPLGDTQNRQVKFKYKDDKDFFNSDYTQIEKKSYGEFTYDSGNNNVKGVKTNEVYFSPTPIVSIPQSPAIGTTASPAMVIPKIVVKDNGIFKKAQSNVRILIRKPRVPCVEGWYFGYSYNQNWYPYAGHIDNPMDPTEDINFGQNEGYYYPQQAATNNTLVNKYWIRTLKELYDKDSRMLRCHINLNEVDIYNFRFNKKIILDLGTGPQYWRVNKIIDYNPINNLPTEVEFIKLSDVVVPIRTQTRRQLQAPSGYSIQIGIGGVGESFSPISTSLVSSGSGVVYGEGSNFFGSNVLLIGDDSSSVGNGNVVIGDGSEASSSKVFISGDDNKVYDNSNGSKIIGDGNEVNNFSENVKIIGDGNKINGNSSDVIIIGNNLNVDEGNKIYISGPLVNNINEYEAGEDEILDEFSDDIIMEWDAGEDEIRGYSSLSIIMELDAGEDSIL